MTNSTMITGKRIETYQTRLEAGLRGVAVEEKTEILREIRAHILDSIAGAADQDAATSRVLRLLGEPEELAARYRTESLLTRASRSYSPWLLLRTSWRWAKLGMRGIIAFFVAVFGYLTAFALTLCLLLKPILPSRVGVWVGPQALNVGIAGNPGMHEILGAWFVPIIALFAFAFAVGTTQALRWLIRKRSPAAAY
jgi:uncharacterized membrane protein